MKLYTRVYKPLHMRQQIEVGFDLKGSVFSLDGVYDSGSNRKLIFNK